MTRNKQHGRVLHATTRICIAAGVLGFAMVLPGCLVASHRKVDVTGREVSQAEFNAIKPGVTTEQDVLEKLGPATATTPMSDGGVMHTWTANKREESSGAVFLILASSSEKTTRQSLNVTCRNGMVTAVSME